MSYVQVLNMDNSPCVFEGRKDNVFSSINEAIRNILIYINPEFYHIIDNYQIKLFGDFDEYVILPEYPELKFIADPHIKSSILAVKALNAFNSFDNNIRIDYIVDGTIQPSNSSSTSKYIKPEKRNINIYNRIKAGTPEIINSIIAKHFFSNFKDAESNINHMLALLEEKTMNLQILLLTRALKEDIHFLSMKMDNLALNNDKYNGYWECGLQETREFQELLEEFINEPKQKVQKINTHIDTENLSKTTEFDDMKTVAESNSKEYREYIYKILFRIQELLSTYNYILDKFTDYLEENGDSYLLYCLKPLNKQFKVISSSFDTLNRYIHGLGNNNQLIINGVNSSIILLKLAEQNINGIHGTEFKETIITFLNKYDTSLKSVLKIDSSNQEVINTLREFNKNCPDADYRLIRYIKDHPQGFEVVSTFASIIGVIEAIATLTGIVIKGYN